MVLEPVEKREQPKQPEREWKTEEKVMVRIEKEIATRTDEFGRPYKTPPLGYRLTFIDNRTYRKPQLMIERSSLSGLLHDFGHILLALTNDEHHLNNEM